MSDIAARMVLVIMTFVAVLCEILPLGSIKKIINIFGTFFCYVTLLTYYSA